MFNNRISAALTTGIAAGLAGTALMTIAQVLEMKIERRGPSKTPAKAAEKVLHIKAQDERGEQRLANLTHWAYGTSWGGVRGALALAGMRRSSADLLYFGLVWGTELLLLPRLKLILPPSGWTNKQIVSDFTLHAIYAAGVSAAFAAFAERTARRPKGLLSHLDGMRKGPRSMRRPRILHQLRAA